MANYNYIQVAMRGEAGSATRTLYSYPASGASSEPRWDSTLVEPGAAIQRFLNASDCYVMQSAKRGRYFSMISRNTVEPAKGFYMISILVEEGCALTGKQMLAAFSALKKKFIEENQLTDEAVDQALESAGIPREPLHLDSWKYAAPVLTEGKQLADAAYRTYISVQELESIFSFPAQPDYDSYRCIIVVSATTSLRPGVKMPRITSPIKKQYTVVCPENVEASSPIVYDGDRLTLVYSRPGYTPRKETVTVGQPTGYAKYDGNTIRVRPANQCGILFARNFNLQVRSAKGNAINGYTVSINGRPVNTMERTVDLTEIDLKTGNTVEIQAASNNYRPLKLELSAEELMKIETLDLVLQPIEQGVTLRLDFGDGRVFEEQISIEKNTPEYNRLHSGNFHGFRAHRQLTQDDSEIYNVDVRFSGRPVAPNFESARTAAETDELKDSRSASHRAPKFENVADEAASPHPEIDMSQPVLETEQSPTNEDGSDDKKPSGKAKWIALVGVAIVLLVVVLTFVLPRGEKLDAEPAAPQDTDTTAVAPQRTAQAEPQHVSPLQGDDADDVAYLNANTLWNASKIKGEACKKLMEAISAGDIEGVVNSDYFAVQGRCTNSRADEIAGLLWRAYGSPVRNANSKALKNASKGGEVDLNNLYEALMRRRPVDEEANTTPRPRR